MKSKIIKLMLFFLVFIGILPHVVKAEETTEDETYAVTIIATHENKRLSYATIMITQDEQTVTYGTTSKTGVATFNLPNGTYNATIGYVSGDYSYYGTTEFTVNNNNLTTTIKADSEFTNEAAEEVYNNTTYYNHVDVRVSGTFTTGTIGNLTTHSIKLKNVELLVTNGNETLIDTTFTDNTETYEWRVTGKQVPNTSVVSLIFDIVLDGEVVRENYVASFSGKEAFIKAIINCDQNQGLDFIIDPTEIVAAALYDVSYVWTGLPSGLANVPKTTEHAPNYVYTIDTQFQAGDVILDESNNIKYTFSGWEEWSNAEDNHAEKNDIGTSETLTITNDTIIYGVWEQTDLTPTSNHIIIKKTFTGNDNRLPESLLFKITDSNTTETYTAEISFNSFKYDAQTQTYTYYFPVYAKGTYQVEELNYDIKGYTFNTTNSTNTIQTITTDLTQEVTVTFNNVYKKNQGIDFHNSGFIVEKADNKYGNALRGATFTLIDQSGQTIAEVITDASGYATFMNLTEGIYTLKETKAPSGYNLDNTEYTITVTLVSTNEVYSATQNAYLTQYEYNVTITPNEHYNTSGSRLTVYNEKIEGSLKIKKEFGNTSAYNKNNYPENNQIEVLITGPNNYSNKITLNKDNNWQYTISNLELGIYTIEEIISKANIEGYNLNTIYSFGTTQTSTKAEVTLTDNYYEEEITITNTYTNIAENIHNEASFSIKKTDSNGKVLSGATFGLYDQNDKLIISKTTDESGIITFTGFKEEAAYILKEITAPTNYIKVDTIWEIKVTLENGKPSTETGDNVYNWNITIDNQDYTNKTLTVINEIKTGSITISKEIEVILGDEHIETPEELKNIKYSFTVIIGDETHTIELKDGETKTFNNIPYNTKYQVYENMSSESTWTHTAPENAEGIINQEAIDIKMINTYNINVGNGDDDIDTDIPQTGYNDSLNQYFTITLLGIIGLILTIKRYNKAK